jgi:hypothetical protein
MAEEKTAILAKNWVKTILAEKGVAKLGTANPRTTSPT